ncbi:uncharacterized protein CMC5_036890 [Chondromyces crocatus]|uniref:Uncharacterized protein n=2 Tax=Chondromyces crocatus TaxID=52 RepID=A0A0K1EFS4_CHOCO|nr:uncharacterized protein CMC5_036890 [Chondromyces crocatus]
MRTGGDVEVAYASVVPLAFLALFDPGDIVALPWSKERRQLTLFARKERALARLQGRASRLSEQFARELSAIAQRRGVPEHAEGVRPGSEVLRARIDAFVALVRAVPGDHVQVFLNDSYFGWDDGRRFELTEYLGAGEARGDGWADALALWDFTNATAPVWTQELVMTALTGEHVARSAEHDTLRNALEDDDFAAGAVVGMLALVLEAYAPYVMAAHRLPWLAEVLGGVSLGIARDLRLRVVTSDGEVAAALPPTEALAGLSVGCFGPLAARSDDELFAWLDALWRMAEEGAFAEGPITCTGLSRDAGPLEAFPRVADAYSAEAIALPPLERRGDVELWRQFGATPEEERPVWLGRLSAAQRIGLYDSMQTRDPADETLAELPTRISGYVEHDPEAQIHGFAVCEDWDDALAELAFENPDPRARVALIREMWDFFDDGIWSRLLDDPVAAVRAEAVSKSDCPEPSRASERHAGVRAASYEANELELVLLAGHADPAVRAVVADNPRASTRTVVALARDPVTAVQRAAIGRLAFHAYGYDGGDTSARDAFERLRRGADDALRGLLDEGSKLYA